MKKVIDLSGKPKNFKDEEMGEMTLGQICAEVVIGIGAHKEHVIKLYCIAQELHTKGKVELDSEDRKLLRGVIEQCDRLTLIAKAQLLLAMDK